MSNIINVGSTRTIKTLQVAEAIAKAGDTILLDAEVFNEPSITIKKPLTIKGGNLHFTGPETFLVISSPNVTIDGVNFWVNSGNWTVTINRYAKQTMIRNCTFDGPKGCFDGIQGVNALTVMIDNCVWKGCTKNYGVYMGGVTTLPMCSDIYIHRCKFNGSFQHCTRFHHTNNLTIDGCDIDNEWDKYNNYHGGCIVCRDGRNHVIINTITHGGIGFGPLKQSPPSIWLDGAKCFNCVEYGSYFQIGGNVRNLNIDTLEIHGDQSGNAVNVDTYTSVGKVPPAGRVNNVKWSYKDDKGVFCKNMVKEITWTNITKI